jgi:uncharacterized protein
MRCGTYTAITAMNSSRQRPRDLRRLDIAAEARAGAALQGHWPLAGFERLQEGQAVPTGQVQWAAQAHERPRAGAAAEVRLHLEASTQFERTCQRCLQPVVLQLQVERDFLFVADEAQAAALDADNEQEDVLELERQLDLHALIEDELLLALPLVPRHDACPHPLPVRSQDAPEQAAEAAHPFAALASLRRPGRH